MDEQVNSEATKALADLNKMGADRVLNLQDQVDRERVELEVMGLSDVERALKLLDYQKELALRGLINEADRKGIEIKYEELKQLAQLKDARAQELQFWGQVGDAAGNFFADLVTNGREAFENLRSFSEADVEGDARALREAMDPAARNRQQRRCRRGLDRRRSALNRRR
jgi:hypothetical protein